MTPQLDDSYNQPVSPVKNIEDFCIPAQSPDSIRVSGIEHAELPSPNGMILLVLTLMGPSHC